MKMYKKEAGYTLIGVLLIFTIASILGLSLVTMSIASVKTSTVERENQSVYYVAEAGLNYQLKEIQQKVEEVHMIVTNYIRSNFIESIEPVDLTEEELEQIAKEMFYNNLYESLILNSKGSKTYERFEDINGVDPLATIYTDDVDSMEGIYKISSTGEIGDQARSIEKQIKIYWGNKYEVEKGEGGSYILPPLTVFTSGNINLSNGPIEGSAGTLSTEQHAIKVGSGVLKVTEEIYVPRIEHSEDNRTCEEVPTENFKSYSVQRPTWENNVPCPTEIDEMWEIPELPDFPKEPTNNIIPVDAYIDEFKVIDNGDLLINHSKSNHYELNMDELGGNLRFNNIVFNSNRNLIINVGDTDKHIVVNHLNIENGHIHLKGKGKLTLHVKNKITLGAGSTINDKQQNDNEHIKQLEIFYSGNHDINLSGSQKLYGSLYAESANMDLTGSGSIYGNVFTGGESVKISGGSEVEAQLILAPKANVIVSGGGSIYGKIISKIFTHTSGAKVIDGEPFVVSGQISPAELQTGTNDSIKNNVTLIDASYSIDTEFTREYTD